MESFSPEAAAGLAKFGVRLLRKKGEEGRKVIKYTPYCYRE